MADIFLSYAREDIKKAELFAAALESKGWSVFWDRTSLLAGQDFEAVIEQAIQQADCIIVAWSEASKQSDWVCGEAGIGRERNNLLPILFEPVEPPIAFRSLHTVNLTDWDGETDTPDFLKLCNAINERIKFKTAPSTRFTPSNTASNKARDNAKTNLFSTAWAWLSVTKHQQTLAFIGGGLSIVIAGGWQAYQYVANKPTETKAPTTHNGITYIEQNTKGDSSPAAISKVPLDNKNVVQKTEGNNSAAIISGGDVSVTSGQ
ncbi:MAG: toll/interleukin-1 receptor domain-containing protein [Gammaproteobacteria bacterium]|nr:toll/interleukin-1 receptor domain-containing protein [Gammaproteobacteria bacterium]